jgi:hypothetical protein
LTAQVTGDEPSHYTVQPPLPEGLSFDEATGSVQGSLGQVSKRNFDVYTITAESGISKATYVLSLPRAVEISTTAHETVSMMEQANTTMTAQRTEASSQFVVVALIIACFLCLLILVLGICCTKSSSHAIDETSEIEPRPENSTSPLLLAGLASESARSLKVCTNGIPPKPDSSNVLSSSMASEIIAAEMEPQHSKGPKAVPLIWDTPDGEQITYARRNQLEVDFRPEFPLRVKREPQGHGKDLGIQVGWILMSVNGNDVSKAKDFAEVRDILRKEVGEKTIPLEEWRRSELDAETQNSMVAGGVPLIWDTPDGERTVYATKKPLGVKFNAEFPLKVKREPEGHSKEIGIKKGWILKFVNGIDVTAMNDIAKVNEILYKEVGEKTVPLDAWARGRS